MHALTIDELMGDATPPLVCWVPGKATGKGRPRFSTQGGKVRTYSPESTVKAENWARACWMEQLGHTLLDGALDVLVEVYMEVPQSWAKGRRARALANLDRPTNGFDVDNLAKLYLDGLNGVAWFDDKQISDLTVTKRFAEAPGVRITVRKV